MYLVLNCTREWPYPNCPIRLYKLIQYEYRTVVGGIAAQYSYECSCHGLLYYCYYRTVVPTLLRYLYYTYYTVPTTYYLLPTTCYLLLYRLT